MVRRLLAQQPQHRFAVKPAQLNQLIHQGTLLLIAQGWVTAAGSLQKLLAPLTLGSAISRCRALHKRNMPNESTKILGVIELTSQRARLPNRRRTRVMTDVLKDDMELFKQFMDNESFRHWMADTVFGLTYK